MIWTLFDLIQLPRRLYFRWSPDEKVIIFALLFKFETLPSKDAFFLF